MRREHYAGMAKTAHENQDPLVEEYLKGVRERRQKAKEAKTQALPKKE